MSVTIISHAETSAGKSTVFNAIVAEQMREPAPVLPAATTECTPLPIELQVDDGRAGRVFTVMYRDGGQVDLPLTAWVGFRPGREAVSLVMYVPAVKLLLSKKVKFIDLPGIGSPTHAGHTAALEEFMADPSRFDVLLEIVSETTGTVAPLNSELLGAPRIVCLNKIDEQMTWDDPTCNPEDLRTSLTKRLRQRIASRLSRTELMPEVVAVSAISGLAARVWTDEILESCLRIADGLAASGDFGQLSARHYFGDAEVGGMPQHARLELSEAASALLRGPWNEPYKPAYPALEFAIGLAARGRITTPSALRERLSAASGIQDLSQMIEKMAGSACVQVRRAHLASVIRSEAAHNETRRLLGETARLLETSHRIETDIMDDGSGDATLEIEHFFGSLRTYLTAQEEHLSAQKQEIEQYWERVGQEYRKSGFGSPSADG